MKSDKACHGFFNVCKKRSKQMMQQAGFENDIPLNIYFNDQKTHSLLTTRFFHESLTQEFRVFQIFSFFMVVLNTFGYFQFF